jgi:TPR repeat protein
MEKLAQPRFAFVAITSHSTYRVESTEFSSIPFEQFGGESVKRLQMANQKNSLLLRIALSLGLVLALAFMASQSLCAQAPATAPAALSQLGTVKSVSGNTLTMMTDTGQTSTITIAGGAKLLQLPAGSTDLKTAKPSQLSDIAVGDRALVTGNADDTPGTFKALRVILIKSADIAQMQSAQEDDWKTNGVDGTVESVDPATGVITIASGPSKIAIDTSSKTVFRRFVVDSVKYQDAKPSSIGEIHPEDRLQARGIKSPDGTSIQAVEIISGSLQQRALAGDAIAEDELGVSNFDGRDIPRDYVQAVVWFRKAADQGNTVAQIHLGSMYFMGAGVPQDYGQAATWYKKAADQGNAFAQDNLGSMWEHGQFMAQNITEARRWFQMAANQGNQHAKDELAKLDASPPPPQAAQAAVAQSSQADDAEARQEIADKIDNLNSDIESREQDAQNNENNANQVLNNCSGPGAALCQALGQAGAARMRQKSAQDRNQADADREEIQRLEGQQVEAGQRRDASYGGNLAQVTQQSPTIQETAAQQQANLQATGAAIQQQRQAQEQARLSAAQNARAAQTTTASQQSSTPQQTILGQSSCTNMTGSVQGSVTVGSDGWVSGHLTNNSVQTLYVFYTFKKDGVPSNLMSNAGATTIGPGQTVGGEGQGLYSTNADKDQARIYWYAVLKSDTDAGKQCVHTW